jgi:hypothetical protein
MLDLADAYVDALRAAAPTRAERHERPGSVRAVVGRVLVRLGERLLAPSPAPRVVAP